MKKIWFKVLLTVFLVPGVTYSASQGKSKEVSVVNTPTVNVGNSVTIDNEDVPVTIQNDLSNPVPVQNTQGGAWVNYVLGGTFAVGNVTLTAGNNPNFPLQITIPAGKRFHVREVACSAAIPVGQTGQLAISGEVILPGGISQGLTKFIPINLQEQSVLNNSFTQLAVYQVVDTIVDDGVTTSPTLTLWGLRSGTTLNTGVGCRLGGLMSDL